MSLNLPPLPRPFDLPRLLRSLNPLRLLRSLFRPNSLAGRLVLMLAATALPALFVAFAWQSARGYAGLQEAVQREMATQAGIVAANASAAMAFGNVQEARAILETLGVSPHVVSAALMQPQGDVFVAFDKRSAAKKGPQRAGGTTDVESALFRLQAPVAWRDQAIGTIVVVGSFEQLHDRAMADLLNTGAVLLAVMIATLVAGRLLAARIIAPIGKLSQAMEALAADRSGRRRVYVEGHDEIARLARHFNAMAGRIEGNEAALKLELAQRERAEGQYAELAYRDAVTGLPNRRCFTERLQELIEGCAAAGAGTSLEAGANDAGFALLFVDLDNFKGVNDTLGHDAGDQLLRSIAVRLGEVVRPTDIVCRLGGDEFAVILTELGGDAPIERLTDKLIQAARTAVTLQGCDVSVSASVGIALYPQAGVDAATLLRNADAAMYQAKASGKDRAVMFTPELLQRATRQFLIRSQLPRAIERNELSLVYQPIVSVSSGRMVKAEALLRWTAASGSFSPVEFIPVAEDSGLIVPIGDWVVNEACRQLAQWRLQGLHTSVAVNVSARQLRASGFAQRVDDALRRHGVSAQALEVELTESQLLGFDDASTSELAALERLGVKLVIDDFGAGFSSLAYLARLSIDGIKIDRALTHDLNLAEGRAVASAILAMAKSLRVEVVAEGVETPEQARILAELGCPLAQGWLYAKPMPVAALAALAAMRCAASTADA
jgi:diguanylate cyclase